MTFVFCECCTELDDGKLSVRRTEDKSSSAVSALVFLGRIIKYNYFPIFLLFLLLEDAKSYFRACTAEWSHRTPPVFVKKDSENI